MKALNYLDLCSNIGKAAFVCAEAKYGGFG